MKNNQIKLNKNLFSSKNHFRKHFLEVIYMNITDIRIRKTYDNDRLKALVSVTIDGELAVHDLKVISGPERLFVAMPSRKDENGVFRDVVHPISPEARKQLEDTVLSAFEEHIAKQEAEAELET